MKAMILQALDLLRDNDPTNDISAYHVLGQTLLFFGDEVNAVTAFSLINAPFERLKESKRISIPRESNELASETRPQLTSPPTRSTSISGASLFANAERLEEQARTLRLSLFWECTGGCDEHVEEYKACYVCKTCFRRHFCDECMTRFIGGKGMFFNCSPSHKLFQVYPLPDRIEDLEVVTIAGEKVRRIEWLAGLRREWLDNGFVKEEMRVPRIDTLGILSESPPIG